MNINIPQILSKGEGVSVEFRKAKNKLPESLFETICAFLNREGGVVLLGVSDDKSVDGVNPESADQLVKNLVNLSNNTQQLAPSFLLESNKIEYDNRLIIHIFVPASSQVHRCMGKVYDRSADGDFELKSDEQIKRSLENKEL